MCRVRELVEISGNSDARSVLYAVPHAGAGVAAVKRMCRSLPDRWLTVGVRLPGRESRTREEPLTDLNRLTDGLAKSIGEHAGDREIHLYGHCAGAIIAYEVARRLPAARLRGLAVSAHQSPDRVPVGEVWRWPREEFLARVREDGYLPDELVGNPELLSLVEPALRADYRAIECHHHDPEVIDVPVLALLGTEEHAVPVEDIRSWGEWTSAGFGLELLPGGHNLLSDSPVEVARAIDRRFG
ncbi:thioesterase II family protein [Streptomyces sp. NPDC001381]